MTPEEQEAFDAVVVRLQISEAVMVEQFTELAFLRNAHVDLTAAITALLKYKSSRRKGLVTKAELKELRDKYEERNRIGALMVKMIKNGTGLPAAWRIQ